MLINVPTTHVFVLNEYITNWEVEEGTTEGYLVAARCRSSEALQFTVHLENGALYSGLPINSIYHIEQQPVICSTIEETSDAQPWSCLPGPANAVELEYLKNYDVEHITGCCSM
jgi:hypothetical protein